jgi:hypothetical protein
MGIKTRSFTSLGASFVEDLQFFVIQPLDEKTTRRMPENIGESQAYSLTVSFPVRVRSGWTIQGTAMVNYSLFDYTYKGSPIHVQQIAGRFNALNAFVFGKGWTGELAGWLRTPAVYALQKTHGLGSLDAGVQKDISTPSGRPNSASRTCCILTGSCSALMRLAFKQRKHHDGYADCHAQRDV